MNDARPSWMTALALFCAVGVLVNVVRDLFFPEMRDVEVWLGIEVRGPAALASAPLHWGILAAGAWGFWRRAPWLWPWAGVYVLYVAVSHLVWSEASEHGRGWPIGLAQMVGIGFFGVLLLRSRSAFQPREEGARALLRAAAPGLATEPLALRTDQYAKTVWVVGERHVLRVAQSSEVRGKLARERALLARLAGSTTLEIPRIVHASPDGGFDILLRAPGEPVEYPWFPRQAPSVQRAVALAMTRFPAELHEAITADEARALGVPPATLDHPPDWVRERLTGRMGSARGERLLAAVLDVADGLYEYALPPVLLHDDIGHHNAGFDPASGQVLGVFDFTEARVGDPHRDLRYAFTYEPFAEEAIRMYERLRGVELQRARLRTLHAWSALTALAWDLGEHGHPEHLPLRRGWVKRVEQWDLRLLDGIG